MMLASIIGGVIALQPTASPVLRVVAVGVWPVGLAVDEIAGRVFVANSTSRTGPGSVSVLDVRTGTVLHTEPIAAGALALDPPAGRAFVANLDDRTVAMLSASSGHRLVTAAALATVPVAVAVDTRLARVFVTNGAPYCCDAGTVSVLDALQGRALTRVRVGNAPVAVAVDEGQGHVFVVNANTVSARSTGTVSMLDARTGLVLYTAPLGLWPTAVAISDSTRRVFVLNNGANTVTVLDARTGAVVRTTAVGLRPVSIAIDQRRRHVYIANLGRSDGQGRYLGGGSVSTLDATSGRVVRTMATALSPADVAVEAQTGHVLVTTHGATDDASATGRLLVLDGSSGATVRTIALRNPGLIAVAERAGRVFVVDDESTVPVPDAWGWLPGWLRRRLPWVPAPPGPLRTLPSQVTVLDLARLR
jgi:YVTN family beta-propeller protein